MRGKFESQDSPPATERFFKIIPAMGKIMAFLWLSCFRGLATITSKCQRVTRKACFRFRMSENVCVRQRDKVFARQVQESIARLSVVGRRRTFRGKIEHFSGMCRETLTSLTSLTEGGVPSGNVLILRGKGHERLRAVVSYR
jgi:hypothetical protein